MRSHLMLFGKQSNFAVLGLLTECDIGGINKMDQVEKCASVESHKLCIPKGRP